MDFPINLYNEINNNFFFCACDNPNKKIDTPAPNADKKQTHTLSLHPPLIKYLEIAATPHANIDAPNDGSITETIYRENDTPTTTFAIPSLASKDIAPKKIPTAIALSGGYPFLKHIYANGKLQHNNNPTVIW